MEQKKDRRLPRPLIDTGHPQANADLDELRRVRKIGQIPEALGGRPQDGDRYSAAVLARSASLARASAAIWPAAR